LKCPVVSFEMFMGLVFLTVENPFTINLDVLSSVLYAWRSLEATVRIRLIPEAGGLSLKPENTREL